MKKVLFFLTIFCLILSSCKKDPVITLSVDKTEISADGVEMATFKVICNDDEDVTKNCRIFFTDTKKNSALHHSQQQNQTLILSMPLTKTLSLIKSP